MKIAIWTGGAFETWGPRTVLDRGVGDCPRRNALVWEVRRY